MKIYRDITKLPVFQKAVLTIGTFDGVHQGHMHILSQLVKEARAIGGSAVLISFFPHPRQVILSNQKPIQLLSTLEEKAALLEKAGIEHLVLVPFSPAFSEQTADAYIKDFLVKLFAPHTIIIGYDHRFGHNREGDYLLLEKVAKQYGFFVKEIPAHILQNINISSTRIREALHLGDMQTANHLLGYPYRFSGLVSNGNKLGRTIGFPTANLAVVDTDKLIPANGVYAVTVVVNNLTYKGMMNIGIRPTVNGHSRVIEVNLFNFDMDIYGSVVVVSVWERIRDEVKFPNLDALKKQLHIDSLTVQKRLLELGN